MNLNEVALNNLKTSIGQLLDKCRSLESEKAVLQSANAELNKTVSEQQNEIQELYNKNEVLKVAKSLGGSDEKTTETKLKINELVREIDKCISLLNK